MHFTWIRIHSLVLTKAISNLLIVETLIFDIIANGYLDGANLNRCILEFSNPVTRSTHYYTAFLLCILNCMLPPVAVDKQCGYDVH